jgi:hypothetical protein
VEVVAFVDEGLGHSSYLVDVGAGDALVVDPARTFAASHRELSCARHSERA